MNRPGGFTAPQQLQDNPITSPIPYVRNRRRIPIPHSSADSEHREFGTGRRLLNLWCKLPAGGSLPQRAAGSRALHALRKEDVGCVDLWD